MARERKNQEADASERRFTTAYYRYDGNQRGSLFDPQSGEPLGRVQNGTILEATDAEHAQRLERHGKFARTTRAKYVEQETAAGRMTPGGEVIPAPTPEVTLDPSLDEFGTFVDAPATGEAMEPVNGDALTTDTSTTGDTSQGGTE
ncbi:hypothetical protein ACFOPQ_01235 [Deinococcus antarcticus]|uniref:Uncharacterized protein n=1 Tax=Deinococcus antarcticus TaxID=1298767 RepID=A0ABV8A138_9DEIO